MEKLNYYNNRLNAHETSLDHLNCYMTWHDLIKRFKGSSTIDAVQQRQMDETTKNWRHVLERLFSIIKFHGSQNVALRGTSDKFYDDNNGCFLKIVELLAKFDPVMKEHIRRIKSKEIYSHYLGKNIQNEIIQILSKAVKEKIVVDLKASKYYSIIVDCTPDIFHIEQITIILRFVSILPTPDEKESYVDIREHFLSFIHIIDTTGAGMTEKILETLDSHGISMQDLRGQGYDNGSNMRSKKKRSSSQDPSS